MRGKGDNRRPVFIPVAGLSQTKLFQSFRGRSSLTYVFGLLIGIAHNGFAHRSGYLCKVRGVHCNVLVRFEGKCKPCLHSPLLGDLLNLRFHSNCAIFR